MSGAYHLYLWLIGVCLLMVVGPCVAIGAAWLWRHRPRFTSDYRAIGERGRER